MIRQIAPRCPGSQDPEDAVEDTSVVYPRNATRLIRQHGLDGNPFVKRTLTNRQSPAETSEMTRIRLRRSNLCGRAISTGHATTPFPRRRPRHE